MTIPGLDNGEAVTGRTVAKALHVEPTFVSSESKKLEAKDYCADEARKMMRESCRCR
jgi:Mn-dependent DtxR family transcriptional regulator